MRACYRGTSRASPSASRTRTEALAATCWLSSIRPSAGYAWRSESLSASSSTMFLRTFFSSPGAPPLYQSERSVGGERVGSVGQYRNLAGRAAIGGFCRFERLPRRVLLMLSISVAGTREIDPTDAVFRDPSSIGDQGW